MLLNKNIFKNTLALYLRQFILISINLYAIRLLLKALGVEDYGIYAVVSGFVTMSSFLPAALSSATQRYFSFAIGKRKENELKKIYSVSLCIHIGFGVFVVLILETLGYLYVVEYIKLPESRSNAAIALYQFSVFTFFWGLVASPFIAMLIAHEDIRTYAAITIVESVCKFACVLILPIIPFDALPVYGSLLLLTSMIVSTTYILICKKKYTVCEFKIKFLEIALLSDIIKFTGWTIYGQLSTVFRNQGVTILLNQAFAPSVAGARAIALTISNQVTTFSVNFNTSLYPPIIKAYSSGQRPEMYSLVFIGSKLSFYLMWLFALPLFIEMEFVLETWLEEVPKQAVYFTQLALVEAVITSISQPLAAAARAPGKLKMYELSLGSLQILIFFVSWIFLELGFTAASVFFVAILASMCMFIVRLIIVNNLTGLPSSQFVKDVMWPIVKVAFLSLFCCNVLNEFFYQNLLGSFLTIISSMIAITYLMYFIGISDQERSVVSTKIKEKIRRLG